MTMNKININSLEIFKTNKYIETEIGKVSDNAYLSIVVTNNCQKSCPYCINSETDRRLNLPIQKAISNIKTVVNKYGVKEAILLGGEPLLHPNILELVSRLRTETNLKTTRLTTNGIFLQKNPGFIKDLVNKSTGIQGINISCHNETDFMSYSKLREVCYKIKEENEDIKIRINSNIWKNNLDNLNSLLDHLNTVLEFSDEVRVSNIIPKDDFSVNPINNEENDIILSNEKYKIIFNDLMNYFSDKVTLIENEKTLGFVRYILIPWKKPIIINWNLESTVKEQICENDIKNRNINTFKCLVNGNISLSWNNNNVII